MHNSQNFQFFPVAETLVIYFPQSCLEYIFKMILIMYLFKIGGTAILRWILRGSTASSCYCRNPSALVEAGRPIWITVAILNSCLINYRCFINNCCVLFNCNAIHLKTTKLRELLYIPCCGVINYGTLSLIIEVVAIIVHFQISVWLS